MRLLRRLGLASLCLLGMVASATRAAPPPEDPPPAWAFVPFLRSAKPHFSAKFLTVPGSTLRITPKQLFSAFFVPDWFPSDHPQMPAVVSRGRAPHLFPCAVCHTPLGLGDPASAAITGLPVAYIEQQFEEFRSGRRRCPVTNDESCANAMQHESQAVTAAELAAAARYFAGLKYRPALRVIETARVPKTRNGGFYLVALDSGTEPIGERIIEVPDQARLSTEGDWRSGVTAYVPPGSLARGKALVERGAGAQPCATCHGTHFEGVGTAPPLAGRPPTYLVRQLYDIRYGYRRGPAVAAMVPEVAPLSARDRIDIAAYLASLGASAKSRL
jgi:cytochrome c553